jgi:hypothetical protein
MAVISAELWPAMASVHERCVVRGLVRDRTGAPMEKSEIEATLSLVDGPVIDKKLLHPDGNIWRDLAFSPSDFGIKEECLMTIRLAQMGGSASWESTLAVASEETKENWRKQCAEVAVMAAGRLPSADEGRTLEAIVQDFIAELHGAGRILSEDDVKLLPPKPALALVIAEPLAAAAAANFSLAGHLSFAAKQYSVDLDRGKAIVHAQGTKSNISLMSDPSSLKDHTFEYPGLALPAMTVGTYAQELVFSFPLR